MTDNLLNVFPIESREVLSMLTQAGHQAHFVGGSLRDAILGIPSDDIDITTSATPEEVIQVFSDYTVIPTGIDHGTVTVVYKGDNIEITTFRVDGDYSDGRHPDTVELTKSLEEDVKRRDFTMNALAYNPDEGLIDYMNGRVDIANQVIRAVGNPEDRFTEDPLRIMRGLRFASKLGFTIESETERAIFKKAELLNNVSVERLRDELDGLLMGENVASVLVKYAEVLAVFIPELEPMIGFDQNTPYHHLNLMEHTAGVVEHCAHDVATRLAGLFHDIGKPSTEVVNEKGISNYLMHAEASVEIARVILDRLKYPTKVKQKVLRIIGDHDIQLSKRAHAIKKKIYDLGQDRFFEMIEFQRADDSSKSPDKDSRVEQHDYIEKFAREYLAGQPILTHKDISFTAQDVIELGYKGADIKRGLKYAVYGVLSGIPDNRDSIENYMTKNPFERAGFK